MLEARRCVRSVWLWVGVAASTWFVVAAGDGAWQADTYQRLQSASMPIALAILVIGRERRRPRSPQRPSAAGRGCRAGCGSTRPRAACSVWLGHGPWARCWAAVVFASSAPRAGCGWATNPVGRTPRCTACPRCSNRSCSSQSPRRSGIALGRACRHRVPLVVGALGFSLFGMVSWAFQSAPMRYVTPIQTQPIEVYIGPAEHRSADPAGRLAVVEPRPVRARTGRG